MSWNIFPKLLLKIVQNDLAGQFRLRTMAVIVQVYLSVVKKKKKKIY